MRIALTILVVALQGCGVTALGTVTHVTTGKSIWDHSAGWVSGADCDATRWVLGQQTYWCEQPRTPDSVYNRNAY